MAMTPAELALISRLLDDALPLTQRERSRWLDELPTERAALAPVLRELLSLSDGLETGELQTLPKIGARLQPRAGLDLPLAEAEQIGPYRLIREIGAGGMGTVWLAERVDGAFKRQVALKLPRLSSVDGLAERMRRERDILAALEHPNIARLYDAGIDAQGRPFLALERVEGQPIDVYCRTAGLPIHDRLKLFLQVLHAVAHSHARLVVHRDLKPSNILVTADGTVRLLDFGVAKLVEAETGFGTQETQFGAIALTPDYASPEQMRGDLITIATDIYSLGVVLYELLAGERPYKRKHGSIGDWESALALGEAPLVSSRVTDRAQRKLLRGDLDTILARALKHQPAQRYSTVEAFAADIENYLDGRPVLTRADSVAYRCTKFIGRHRFGFAASTLIVLAVLGGAGAVLWQAHRAAAEAERARLVKEFVADLFRIDSQKDGVSLDWRQLPAASLLELGARRLDASTNRPPQVLADLLGVVGTALADLGVADRAAHQAQKQLEVLEAAGASAAERIGALELLARAQMLQERPAEAAQTLRRALELGAGAEQVVVLRNSLVRALLEQNKADAAAVELAKTKNTVSTGKQESPAGVELLLLEARLLAATSSFDDALATARRALEISERISSPESALVLHARRSVVWALFDASLDRDALAEFEILIAAMRRHKGSLDIDAALTEMDFATQLLIRGVLGDKAATARLEHAKQILEGYRSYLPPEVLARAELGVAGSHLMRGEIADARESVERARQMLEKSPQRPRTRLRYLIVLGITLAESGEHDEAEAALAQAGELARAAPSFRFDAIQEQMSYAKIRNRLMKNDVEGAEQMFVAAFGGTESKTGMPTDWRRTRTYLLASIDNQRGKFGAAAERLQPYTVAHGTIAADTTLDVLRDTAAFVRPWRVEMLEYGRALCALGDLRNGVAALETSTMLFGTRSAPICPYLALARAHLGLCALKSGDRIRATEMSLLASKAMQDQPQVSDYFKQPILDLERQLKVHGGGK
jgi:tetratricopeptide (TPR) repeat protein